MDNNLLDLTKQIQKFYASVEKQLDRVLINTDSFLISHICFRTASEFIYENIRDWLKLHCREFVETQFNGRSVSILILKKAIFLSKKHSVEVIELPAPREIHTYPNGLEHIGYTVGDENKLNSFKVDKHNVLSGEKIRPFTKPAFVEFKDGSCAKFYERSLYEIVKLQGWNFENLG